MRADVRDAVNVLRSGGLVALPTETVYGLGADAENELAVRRIFAVKGRPSTHPLIVHVADAEAARSWCAGFPEAAEKLARELWPGPLTLILPRSARAADVVTGGQETVGLRVPAHPLAEELLRAFGGGIAAPSANRFGHLSPTTAQHVREELGAEVDLVLDGGPCTVGVESSIVDLSGPSPRLLRPGGVPRETIERILGVPVPLVTAAPREHDVRAPGTLESHYAPRAGLVLLPPEDLASEAARRLKSSTVAVLASPLTALPSGVVRFDVPADGAAYARVLYATLREADARGVDVILAAPPPASGLGLAVRDRLTRAAAPRPPR